MRLFAALLPPPGAADELAAVVRGSLARLPGAGRLRWTERDGWHITLAYYGETPGTLMGGLRDGLARVASERSPLGLRLAGGESLGEWALGTGVEGERAALASLAAAAADAGRAAGTWREADQYETYRPHLTLARQPRRDTLDGTDGTDGGPVPFAPFLGALCRFTGGSWRAAELVLLSSEGPTSGRYTRVAAWPLDG